MDQRRFAGAGNAGDGDQHSEWNIDVEGVEVVGGSSAQDQAFAAGRAAARGDGNGELAGEITAGERIGVGFNFGENALGKKLATQFAGAGAEVEEMIGGAKNVGVVLDDDDGVAQIAQLFQDSNEAAVSREWRRWKARRGHKVRRQVASRARLRAECAAPLRQRAWRRDGRG